MCNHKELLAIFQDFGDWLTSLPRFLIYPESVGNFVSTKTSFFLFQIAVQHSRAEGFCDVFVWGWNECQNPKYLYTKSFQEEYPEGMFLPFTYL